MFLCKSKTIRILFVKTANFANFFLKYEKQILLGILVAVIISLFLFFKQNSTDKQDALRVSFERGEVAYQNRRFKKAANNFHNFIELAEDITHEDKRVIHAIDRLGRIYLSIRHNPKTGINILKRFVDHPGLNKAENEELHEWIAVAEQRLKYSSHPKEIEDPNELFSLGKHHYDQAMEKKKFKVSTSKRHFEIAESFLLQFVESFENSKNISEVYYMLGVIEKHILTQEKWAEHFYLKEAIRSAPHTPIAQKAYNFLYREIHSENTKNGKDLTHESIEESLLDLKNLAKLKPGI